MLPDQTINIVSPLLHHDASLIKILCPVVGGTHPVLFHMGELHLNDLRTETHFIETGRGHAAKAVDAHLLLAVAQAAQADKKSFSRDELPRDRR